MRGLLAKDVWRMEILRILRYFALGFPLEITRPQRLVLTPMSKPTRAAGRLAVYVLLAYV